jgi:hypothetical protein
MGNHAVDLERSEVNTLPWMGWVKRHTTTELHLADTH